MQQLCTATSNPRHCQSLAATVTSKRSTPIVNALVFDMVKQCSAAPLNSKENDDLCFQLLRREYDPVCLADLFLLDDGTADRHDIMELACKGNMWNTMRHLVEKGYDCFAPRGARTTFMFHQLLQWAAVHQLAVLLDIAAVAMDRVSADTVFNALTYCFPGHKTPFLHVMLNKAAPAHDPGFVLDFIYERCPNLPVDIIDPATESSLLFTCVKAGFAEASTVLLSRGASVNRTNCKTKSTALHASCFHNHVYLTRLLLDYGADPNMRDGISALTPLHYASAKGFRLLCKMLLQVGADWRMKDSHGRTCLLIAAAAGHFHLLPLFPAGARIDSASDGSTLTDYCTLHNCAFLPNSVQERLGYLNPAISSSLTKKP